MCVRLEDSQSTVVQLEDGIARITMVSNIREGQKQTRATKEFLGV